MTDAADFVCEESERGIFSNWEPKDFNDLVRLMKRFAEAREQLRF